MLSTSRFADHCSVSRRQPTAPALASPAIDQAAWKLAIPIKCGVVEALGKKTKIPACTELKDAKEGWINGRLDWYSQGGFVGSPRTRARRGSTAARDPGAWPMWSW